MSNLFQKTSSNWVRYDKYEWKEDKEGTLYIIPSPDAKVSLYNPLKNSEQMAHMEIQSLKMVVEDFE